MFVEKIEAITAPPSSTALTAAKALSKVDDPVAVPYLADVLNRKVFAELMIPALARLKTDKAIDALTAASPSGDRELLRSLVQAAPVRIGETRNQ